MKGQQKGVANLNRQTHSATRREGAGGRSEKSGLLPGSAETRGTSQRPRGVVQEWQVQLALLTGREQAVKRINYEG